MEEDENNSKQAQGCRLDWNATMQAQHSMAGQQSSAEGGKEANSSQQTAHLERLEQNIQVGVCKLRLTQAKLAEVWHYGQGFS